MYKNVMSDLESYFYSNPKFNSRIPTYNDDSDYTTNAPSYYDDLARKNKLMKVLALRIWEYEEEMIKRLEQWDKNLEDFPEDVKDLLEKWLEDGTLDHIINDTIFNWKADKTYVDEHFNIIHGNLSDMVTNIKNFGAIGNGLKDDTLAIQNAIDHAANKKAPVFIPDGEYITTQPIIIPKWVDVFGSGRSSRITSKHGGEVFIIDKDHLDNDLYAEEQVGGYISNFSIIREDRNRTGTAIRVLDFVRGKIDKMFITGFDKAIDTSGHFYVGSIVNNHITNNKYGIYLFTSNFEGDNPKGIDFPMVRKGIIGGTIKDNDINQNDFGLYFENYINQNNHHNHGVNIMENAIQGNAHRAIRLTYGTGKTNIHNNYFEANGRDDRFFDVNNLTGAEEIHHIRADILIDTHAIGSNSNSTAGISIKDNQSSASSLFVACGYSIGLVFEGNRLANHGIYFYEPVATGINRSIEVKIGGNTIFGTGNVYINDPTNFTSDQFGEEMIKQGFATTGYLMTKDSVSPLEDLEDIPDNTFYYARAYNKNGYPYNGGSISGFKSSNNNYKYSWQEFNASEGAIRSYRYALSPTEWSEWFTLQISRAGTSVNRPDNPPVGFIYLDSTTKKAQWFDGNNWYTFDGTVI